MIALSRPYHWITVLWGKRYRDYFTDICLPSMLSPGNLPAVDAPGSKFLVATTPEDWAAMQAHPIFKMASRHIDMTFVEIPAAPAGKHGCAHMGVGHVKACEIAYWDKAYAGVIAPDCLFSDGSIGNLARHAAAGKKVVMVPACLRIAEEPFLARLRAMGTLWGVRGQPITATGRQVAAAAFASLHSAARIHEWDSWLFGTGYGLPAIWFRVPGEDGMVIHCLSWGALMTDYAAFDKHDISCLTDWTIDGDYVFKNLGNTKDIHVVRDSDEVFYAGFTPLAEQAVNFEQFAARGSLHAIETAKLQRLRSAFHSGLYDPLKQSIFAEPVRWHAREVIDRWAHVETRAADVVRQAMELPEEMAA